jgi:hypothetical protein
MAIIALPVIGEDPPDRLAAYPEVPANVDSVVSLIATQTSVLESMSEKLSRIELIVTDTNERTATSADVTRILERLEALQGNLHPVAQATPGAERIIAIDGVPINQVPINQVPASPGYALDALADRFRVETSSRPLNKEITITDVRNGLEARVGRGPFRQTINADPGMRIPDLGPLASCIGGRCVQNALDEYFPDRVTTPANDGGLGGRGRLGILGRLFGRRR